MMQDKISGVQAITVDGKMYTNVTDEVTIATEDNVEETADGTGGNAGTVIVIAVRFLGSYASVAPILSKPEVTSLTIHAKKDIKYEHSFEVMETQSMGGYIITFRADV